MDAPRLTLAPRRGLMLLKQLFDQETWTYTYLLADEQTREAVIIDPVVEQVERDLRLLDELGLHLKFTLDTHVHADHVTASGLLRHKTGAVSGLSATAEVACVDQPLHHGDTLAFGSITMEVRETPGHTDGCLTYVVQDDGQTYAFTGDALFIRGCGRTDFQQGDSATLYRSVHQQIFSLPEDTLIYPGHDYRGHSVSTVKEEKAHNPRLKLDISEEQFVEIMAGLNLSHPKRIHEALPANLACGLSPDHTDTDGAQIRHLPPEQVDAFDGLIVDVRSWQEFVGPLGHLPTAMHAPLPTFGRAAKNWRRDLPILLVCQRGGRSQIACELSLKLGFTQVHNLDGGMVAYRKFIKGLPA